MRVAVVMAIGAVLLLCTCPLAVRAIYEDQAGQYDWLKQHVGRVKLAQLVSRPRARLYVASEAGALAAVAPANGRLLWRKVLAEGDTISHLQVAGSQVLTLSDGGRQLRAWDADTGAALWAVAAGSSEEVAGSAGNDLAVVPKGDAVVVALGSIARAYSLADGKPLWATNLGGSAGKGSAATKLFGADSGAWAATVQSGASQLTVAQLSIERQAGQQASLDAGSTKLSTSQLLVTDRAVAALSADGSKLCAADLASGSTRLACQRLAALLPAGTQLEGARLVAGTCQLYISLQVAGGAAVLAIGGSDGASLVKFQAGATAAGCMAGEAPLVALASPSPSAAGLQVQVVSAADGSAVQQPQTVAGLAPQRMDGAAVGVAALFAGAAGRAGDLAFRQLVVFEDDSLALVEEGQQAWVRHEELAAVTDVLFTDLPAPTPENEAQWQAQQPGFSEMLAAQVITLKLQAATQFGLGQLVTPEERRRLERYQALTSDKLRPTRDADGFRKQLVVLTSGGKVLALHNGDGRLLWSLDFGPAAAPRKLALWRLPHDMQHDTEIVAITVGGDSTTATVINARTGAVQQTLSAAGAAADLLHLPQPVHDNSADQRVFVLVPAGGAGAAVQLLPDTQQARAAFEAARPSFSFWRADKQAGTVQGLGFAEGGAVEERWSVVLAPAGGAARILHVAAHTPGEAVSSPARVLGNGDLKFKYLNPNSLLVAVGVPARAAGSSGGNAGEERLTVVVLDAVTGRVLFSQKHEGATGPVHAVLSENMAAYHFWSTEAHRWEVASLELYDASPSTLKVSDLAFGETNSTTSSWDAPPLETGSQSFLFRLPVAGLAVTRSGRGITAKRLIMLTTSGQVYLLDRRFLDPRRPIIPPGQKPTPEQIAEALPPYAPDLPVMGPMFATLNHEVKRLRGVSVEAAELESTMLMLAHGMDLFYTRLMPSRSFDMVPDDFPYALLVLIVVSLATATVVLKLMTTRTAVKAKWQ